MRSLLLLMLVLGQSLAQAQSGPEELAELLRQLKPKGAQLSQRRGLDYLAREARNTQSRHEALATIGAMGILGAPALQDLKRMLADPLEPRRIKMQVLVTLGQIGQPAQPALHLVQHLAKTSKERDIRTQAAKTAEFIAHGPNYLAPPTASNGQRAPSIHHNIQEGDKLWLIGNQYAKFELQSAGRAIEEIRRTNPPQPLFAEKINNDWILIKGERSGKAVRGWIHAKNLAKHIEFSHPTKFLNKAADLKASTKSTELAEQDAFFLPAAANSLFLSDQRLLTWHANPTGNQQRKIAVQIWDLADRQTRFESNLSGFSPNLMRIQGGILLIWNSEEILAVELQTGRQVARFEQENVYDVQLVLDRQALMSIGFPNKEQWHQRYLEMDYSTTVSTVIDSGFKVETKFWSITQNQEIDVRIPPKFLVKRMSENGRFAFGQRVASSHIRLIDRTRLSSEDSINFDLMVDLETQTSTYIGGGTWRDGVQGSIAMGMTAERIQGGPVIIDRESGTVKKLERPPADTIGVRQAEVSRSIHYSVNAIRGHGLLLNNSLDPSQYGIALRDQVSNLAISRNGERVATQQFRLIRVHQIAPMTIVGTHEVETHQFALSADGTQISYAQKAFGVPKLGLFDVESGLAQQWIDLPGLATDAISAIHCIGEKRFLVAHGAGICKANFTDKSWKIVWGASGTVRALAVSPINDNIIAIVSDGGLQITDLSSQQVLHQHDQLFGTSICFSADGKSVLLAGHRPAVLNVVNLQSGMVDTLANPPMLRSKLLRVANHKESILVYNVPPWSSRELYILSVRSPIRKWSVVLDHTPEFSNTAELFAVRGREGGGTSIRRADVNEEIAFCKFVGTVSFSPQDSFLAITSKAGTHVWSTKLITTERTR